MKTQPLPPQSSASCTNYSLVNPSLLLSLFIEMSYQDIQPQEQKFQLWGRDTLVLGDKNLSIFFDSMKFYLVYLFYLNIFLILWQHR